MRSARPKKTRSSDQIFIWVIGGALLLVVLLLVLFRGSEPGPKPLESFSLEWKASPLWGVGLEGVTSQQAADHAAEKPSEIAIYLDVSSPMGGFIPPETQQEGLSGLRTAVHSAADSLVHRAGRSSTVLRWVPVSGGVHAPIARPKLLDRALFGGTSSRLDLAASRILEGFRKGRLEAAVVVTDLIATEEVIGAMGAGKALGDWMESPQVRSGELHLAVVGVRADYWGFTSASCPADPASGLGCRFSEQAHEPRKLTQVAKIPFYLLVFTHGMQVAEDIAKDLEADFKKLDLEVKWELLTRSSSVADTSSSCLAHKLGAPSESQFALSRGTDNSYRCQRNEKLEISCNLPLDVPLTPESASTSWPEASSRLEGGKLKVVLDCKALASASPQSDLRFKVEGPSPKASTSIWTDWTSSTDELESDVGRTLQLEQFMDKVRLNPIRRRLESEAVLRGRGDGRE